MCVVTYFLLKQKKTISKQRARHNVEIDLDGYIPQQLSLLTEIC